MKYRVWIKDRKEETEKIIDVMRHDFTTPTPMNVKDTACKTLYFGWGDYTKLRFRKLTGKDIRELRREVKSVD